jgi:hypothetical protein
MIGPRASGSRLAQTALIVSVFGMPGCLPVYWEQFYKPDPDGATVASYRCGGGPKNLVEVTVNSVKVSYGLFPRDDELGATISFLIPEGRTVRLLATRVIVQPAGSAGEIRFISRGGWTSDKGLLFADETMVGKTREHSFPTYQEHALYVARAQIHGAPPSVVTVTFPTFLIDDRAVDARVIRFHLDRHVQFMVPINC